MLLVGCGRISGGFDENNDLGVRSHARAYQQHPGFRLAACVDPDEDRRAAFVDHWQISDGFDNLATAIESGIHFDVASVCTPTAQHVPDLQRLLHTEVRAVFCEKPVALDLTAATNVVAAYDAAKIPLAVNHLRRWDDRIRNLREELNAGQWGAIRSAVGLYTKGILNNGTHMVDLMLFLVGPLAVCATGPVRNDGAAGDPTVNAILTSPTGATAHLVGADARDFSLFELTIVTEKGVVAIEDSGHAMRVRGVQASRRYAGYRELEPGISQSTALDAAFSAAVDNIHAAVTSGEPLASDGHTALAAHQICTDLLHRVQP